MGPGRLPPVILQTQWLPVVTPKDKVVISNFHRARYAAFWHVRPPVNARIVWQGNGGTLVTR